MNTKKAFKNFNTVVAIWEKELENYDMVQLSQKEDNESWSMGQLYKHLIDGTINFHLKQVHLCLNSADHKTKKKNAKGFVAYHIIKGFPPIKIKVPASETYT